MPRRIYTKPGDFEKNGYTEGCPGCTWLVNKLGPRVNHNDGCRIRMEKIIGEDDTDERTKKMKDRFDHYLAQPVDDGDVSKGSAGDPRQDALEAVPPEELRDDDGGRRADPERYDIGSP